jgi:hypothetical protein
VIHHCNTNTNSDIEFGNVYISDTGPERRTVFEGSPFFRVKEIEVFEVTE